MASESLSGKIVDLSIAGMACTVEGSYPKGTHLDSIHLQLWGTHANVSGTIAGTRNDDGEAITVVLFASVEDGPTRSKIYSFLKRVMQHEVDRVVQA